MSKPSSVHPSAAVTPVPSSPQPSESFFSDLDGTASVLDASGFDFAWDSKVDPGTLNIVSWKLDVNAKAEDGVERRGFNAISTVLNHPTKKANPLRSSRKPLPPIGQPLPSLPKPPPPSHYDNYLKAITPLYDVFATAQASSSSTSQPVTGEYDVRPPEIKSNLPSLKSIPDMFFEANFDLANPLTWTDLVGIPSNSPSATIDPTIQDSLSSHLDTIERHLEHEITLRSTSFFSALSNLQDLHSESASCLSRISELQASLKEVGSKQARKGLEIIDAQESLRVLRITEGGVKRIAELEEIVRFGRNLVEEGDWTGGLGCLEDVVRWWERYELRNVSVSTDDVELSTAASQPTNATLPLSTLPALAILPTTVQSLTSTIASQLESALSLLLLSVLSRAESPDPFDSDSFKSSIRPIVAGLIRCGRSEGIEDAWRNAVTLSIREGSRQHLPLAQGDDDGDESNKGLANRGQSLAQSLQAMDHSGFLLLATQMYGTMLARIQLAQKMGEDLANVFQAVSDLPVLAISTSVTESSSPPSSAKLAPAPNVDFSDVISSACELANSRASKILAVRSEQHAELSLTEFVEIFKESWAFVLATEGIAKRMIVSLRGVTASQSRSFLVSYHAVRLTKSAKQVEDEQWGQIDIPTTTQHVVNLLIQAAVSDPEECRVPPPMDLAQTNGDASIPAAKVLSIEDRTFFVVKATAETLELLGDYLKIVINLELVVTDVMSRIIEYLKSFNSRTCQVVLGAGAMRSAGLKNITAKHLALASQSLSVIVNLIPYIREFIRRHLNAKQAVMLIEFDKLKRDYQEHQNEIHSKLVAIMSDRLAVHCSSLRAIDWETSPDSDGPRSYAEMLVKETATLHKVLSKYLAPQTVESVMSQVLAAIVHRLSEEYRKIELKSDDAKKRMTQDVNLLSSRLSSLSDSGKSVQSLETLVKDKSTPRRPLGQTMTGLLRRNTSTNVPKKEDEKVNSGNDRQEKEEEAENGDEEADELGMTEEPAQIENNGVSEENVEDDVEARKPDTTAGESNGTAQIKAKGDSTDSDDVKGQSEMNGFEKGVGEVVQDSTTGLLSAEKTNNDSSLPPTPIFSDTLSESLPDTSTPVLSNEDPATTELTSSELPPPLPTKDEIAKDEDSTESAPPIPEKNDTPL